jgi:fibronectin type 3 domain-containing protein
MPVPSAPVFPFAVRTSMGVQVSASPAGTLDTYRLKRSTINGGPYTVMQVSASPVFLDQEVVIGQTYYYVMSGVSSSGESLNSAQVTAVVTAIAPAAPVQIVAAHYDGLLAVVAVCTPESEHICHYRFKRSFTPGGPYDLVWLSTDCVFADSQVSFGRPYYYVVSAVTVNGESPNSVEVTITPMPEPQ